mgnify:CR=1 FL=1
MQRLDWIDIAKFLGIVLVVSGHVISSSSPGGAYIVWFIFLFHMPLFFVLSGYVFRSLPASVLMRRRAKTLLIPYISFIGLICVVDSAVYMFTGILPSYWSIKGFIGIALGGRLPSNDSEQYGFLHACLLL